MKVTFANGKGGTGKTCSATVIAAVSSEEASTVLVDCDHQQSAFEWAEMAAEDGTPLPFHVIGERGSIDPEGAHGSDAVDLDRPDRLASVIDGLAERFGNVIIDTGQGVTEIGTAAIAAADLCVIPTRTGLDDLRRLGATSALADAHGTVALILLAQGATGTIALRDARQALASLAEADEDLLVMAEVIPSREHLQRLFGRVPAAADLDVYRSTWVEIRGVFDAFYRGMADG